MRRGDRWDELFTLLFMLLAIAAGILYFTVKGNRLSCCDWCSISYEWAGDKSIIIKDTCIKWKH